MNEIMPCEETWVDLETIILSKVSLKEKDKYHTIFLHAESLKMIQVNSVTKQEQIHRLRE